MTVKPATRNVLIFTVILLAVFGVCAWAKTAGDSTGAAGSNTGTGADTGSKAGTAEPARAVAPPEFSRASGFYKDEFSLSMDCASGCEIYYTLDGSDPDPASALHYDAPLRIDDASNHENVYSMNTDTSTGFYAETIKKVTGFGSPGYEAPKEPIDKCTILRAVAVSEDGTVSRETFATYFVSKTIEDYTPCNVVSLMTDPDNLFDDTTGIYVTGDRYRNYLARGENRWTKWDANYHMSGPDSERPASFQLFDTNGRELSARDCRIRIHGNVTRAYNQKSFSIFFGNGETVSGTDTASADTAAAEDTAAGLSSPTLGADIFNTGYDPKELILSNGGQNMTTKFNNPGLAEAMDDDPMQRHYEPAVLFLDGEYWGFYWITERYDEDWFEHYFGIDYDNTVAVKFDAGKDYAIRSVDPLIREQENNSYEEVEQFVISHDMSDSGNYAKAGQLLDLDNFIDYYAIETYLANADWPTRNKEYWRAWAVDKSDLYADGRWRALIFDLDLALDTEYNGLQRALDKDDIFAALWANQDFRKQFKKRIFYFADEVFSPEKMTPIIDDYVDTYGKALWKSWNRFYKDRPNFMKGLRGEMDQRAEFFEKRRAVVETWFQ